MITVKRIKHFCGSMVPYKIIMNCDIDVYQNLTDQYNKLIVEKSYLDNEQLQELEKVAEELDKIPYTLIKNGEEIKINNTDLKSIFVCINDKAKPSNNIFPTDLYPFTHSNQLNVIQNKKYILYTKFHWKKNELILKEID